MSPIIFLVVAFIYIFNKMSCKIFQRPPTGNENDTGETFLLDNVTNPAETPKKVLKNPFHKYVESAAAPTEQPNQVVPGAKVEPKSSPTSHNSIDPTKPGPSGLNNGKFLKFKYMYLLPVLLLDL